MTPPELADALEDAARWRPCCAEHPDACPMCRRPWDAPGDADGEECWICWRLCSLEGQ